MSDANKSDKTPRQPKSGAVGWETVHVFVSSTFNDMHGERDYLVKEVFPELRDWCEERKLRLVDIDLRWGVTETDATRNKNVVQVCLDRIDKARPFFICFLGQRYGWVPKDKEIAKKTFEDFAGLGEAVADSSSVTEMEVLHALLSKPFDKGAGTRLPMDHAFFYMRTPAYLSKLPKDLDPLRRTYADAAEPNPERRRWLLNKRKRLRMRVRQESGRPVRWYGGRWNPEARTPELALPLQCPSVQAENRERWRQHWMDWAGVATTKEAVLAEAKARDFNQRLCAGRLEEFWSEGRSLGEVILADLKAAILARYPERAEMPEQDDLEKEIDRHEDFIRTAPDVFIEREGDFAALDAYAGGDSRKLFVLVAKAGLGKSTLLAKWVERWRSREGKPLGETVHARFVGVAERSSTVDSLLRSILEELRRTGKLASEIPDNANVLRNKLAELLGECAKKGRTIVVIDALNQLQSGLSDLDWLARTLPENVKLVVSFKLGDEQGDALVAQMRADERVTTCEVQPFTSLEHRRSLVAAFLRQYLKELDEQHLQTLIRSEGADNPLFLKVVLTELRVFGAFARLGEMIKNEFGTTPQSAFDGVLRRLENDPSYAAVPPGQAVPLVFGLLAHAHGGLPEDLLVRMLLQGLRFGENRSDAIRSTIRLLLRQMRPFLARRDGRSDFFYEPLQLAASRRYTGTGEKQRPEINWHADLARTCDAWRTLTGPGQRYALTNLPRHELAAEKWEALTVTMTDFAFAEAKCEAGMVYDLVGDHRRAKRMPGKRSDQLADWARFVDRRSNVLARFPHLFLQQALLEPQTESIAPAAEPRVLSTHRPHLRVLIGAEKPTPGLLRLLVGHTTEITCLAISPDRCRVLAGARDGTVRVWDLHTGEFVSVLGGHEAAVRCIALTPDYRMAVAGACDGTLRWWNLADGACIGCLRGYSDSGNKWTPVAPVSVSPDGRLVASANGHRLWDLETGRVLRLVKRGSQFTARQRRAMRRKGLPRVRASRGPEVNELVHESPWLKQRLEQFLRSVADVGTTPCWAVTSKQWNGRGPFAITTTGELAVSADNVDCAVRVWDVVEAERIWARDRRTDASTPCDVARGKSYPGQGGQMLGRPLALSPDGTRLLCTVAAVQPVEDGPPQPRSQRRMGHYDLRTKEYSEMLADAPTIESVTSDLKWALAFDSTSNESLAVWDLAEGHRAFTLQCPPVDTHTSPFFRYLRSAAISPEGCWAVLGDADGQVSVWKLTERSSMSLWRMSPDVNHSDWRCSPTRPIWRDRAIRAVAIGSEGRRLATANEDGTLTVWDLASDRFDSRAIAEISVLHGHAGAVTSVALSSDGRLAFTGGHDGTVRAWDLEKRKCVGVMRGHAHWVWSIVVFPGDARIASRSRDGTTIVWDVETRQALAAYLTNGQCIAGPDGLLVCSEYESENIFVLRLVS